MDKENKAPFIAVRFSSSIHVLLLPLNIILQKFEMCRVVLLEKKTALRAGPTHWEVFPRVLPVATLVAIGGGWTFDRLHSISLINSN